MNFAIARELTDIPNFRKYLYIKAYQEGWGLYTEKLAKELGAYKDPYSDFGRLTTEIWRAIHRRIYEAQPMLFGFNPPRKFAINKKLFGFQAVPVDPHYILRRWYYPEGTPGTRAERERPREAGGN